ncbi:hypothetical protein BKI52_37305 [marine bacterium AO1-C]|nr:hypothetical protein BKI52_37305 [marine bacterium AO1-C]
MQKASLAERFRVNEASLESIKIHSNSIEYHYALDGEGHRFRVSYNSVNFFQDFALSSKAELHAFAVILGIIGFARFGAVLPKRLTVNEFSEYVPGFVYQFLQEVLPGVWSEHRYQLEMTDFKHPAWKKGDNMYTPSTFPLFAQDSMLPTDGQKVLLTSGAGKDSLLCAQLLEQAHIEYDLVTLFFSLYGQFDQQKQMFRSVIGQNQQVRLHQVYFEDEYYQWLEERLTQWSIREIFPDKPFRVEAGETLISSLAYVPVQLAHRCSVQAWGNEKSADLPNLVLPDTGEPIAHQWSKSLEAEQLINDFLAKMFVDAHRSSLIKPLHDVRIFKTLFEISGNLPYATNSCNIAKPWCGHCEKCAYVFLGFATYGNYDKTIEAFGQNLLDKVELLPIWEELLGLKEYISWECVGSAEEAQIYFYKMYKKGIDSKATQLFEHQILQPMRDQGMNKGQIHLHFKLLEQRYLKVHSQHHTLPQWIMNRIRY